MSQFIYDAVGQKLELSRLIGRGGEGAVYEVQGKPDLVAKIYEKPIEKERAEKLACMIKLSTPAICKVAAWPRSTLHKSINTPACGLLMPYLKGERDIHELYSPAQRRAFFPYADWKFLILVAANCAAAFDTLHQSGCIVGDVNQSNIRVDRKAYVKFIDCDSFQITYNSHLYECGVGVPFFTPPELQGKSLSGIERTINHDSFGLGLLVFHLLFMGRHPFAGRFQQNVDMPIEKAIREYRFAFGPKGKAAMMLEPPHSLAWQALPREIGVLFERTFCKEGQAKRPSPLEWRDSLLQLSKNLKECTYDPGHKYFQRLTDCPWCSIMNTGGPNFFISVVTAVIIPSITNYDLQPIWNQINNIRFVKISPINPAVPLNWKPVLTRLPESLSGVYSNVRYGKVPYSILQHMTMYTAIIGLLLVPWGNPWTLLGTVIIAFFAVWFVVLEYMRKNEETELNRDVIALRSAWSREHSERSANCTVAEAALNQINYLFSTRESEMMAAFNDTKMELEQLKNTYQSLDSMYQHEMNELGNASEQSQREAFLKSKFIQPYSIDGIGQARTATLRSYGIETAWDIDVNYIWRNVPGFGESLTNALLDWRHKMESQFQFNRNVAITQADRDAIKAKYNRMRSDIQRKLNNGPASLNKINAMYAEMCKQHNQHAQKAYLKIIEAHADLDMLGTMI